MTAQASHSLRRRNPDVLTCIANLSNDEVFTPPEFAGRMLDTLATGWAAGNNGADIWADSKVRFLDPCTKSGVFLREIATRLIKGLAEEIPDLQTRVDHILTKQVFGIGITRLTSLLARRSLYCSKHANGEHSVAKGFASDEGNVWFERTEHSWDKGRCVFCGAGDAIFDRDAGLESHAYAFTHTDDINIRISDHFVAEAREFAPLRSAPLVAESPRPENTGPTKFGKGEPPSEFARPEKLKHTDRRVLSPIQLDLWNKANWHGTAFMQYPDMPGPILALHFRDADAARRIFEDWRDRWGIEGSDDNVRISIITGVTKANPFAYSMQIGPVYRTSDEQSGKTFMTMSRMLRLDASTPDNLNRFLEAFQKAGSYGLVAAFTPPGEKFPAPMTELLLPRRNLEVRPAWMIDENDPDLSVMQDDDDPFIPDGMADPPVLRAMARLRQFRRGQAAS